MALSYKARRRWSLFLLLVWLPLYIALAAFVLSLMGDLHMLVSIPVYLVLGVAWAFPFKSVFKGIGKADPDSDDPDS